MEKSEKLKDNKSEGTLIRGADGELYFVPDDKLQSYKLPEKRAKLANKLFFSDDGMQLVGTIRGDVVKDRLALVASDSTTVNIVNIGSIRQLKK